MPTVEPPPPRRRAELVRLLDYSVIGLVFPVSMVLGFLGGRLVGGWFGAAHGGSVIGGLLGVAAGFYNVFKMVARLDRSPPDG